MKKTFLVLVGASHNGQLFHTVRAKNKDHAFELLVAYLTANGFEGVKYNKELETVFCIGWYSASLISEQRIHTEQKFGCVYFNIENSDDWAL